MNDIKNLLKWLSGKYKIPRYKDLRIAVYTDDVICDSSDMKIALYKKEFYPIEEYRSEYDIKRCKGYSWINMQCAGLYKNDLVIVIEYPSNVMGVAETSINFSGPFQSKDGNSLEWDIETMFKLI